MEEVCRERGQQLDMQVIDILRGTEDDLADPDLQARWLKSLGIYQFVITTPPCSTHSRAVWANPYGPCPIRSRKYPLGFPWLGKKHRAKADLYNALIDFTWKVLYEVERLSASRAIFAFAEHPEDLGRVRGFRLAESPASIWQSNECITLVSKGWWCGAFNQDSWGAPTAKPTRGISNSQEFKVFGQSALPAFNAEGY